MKHTVIFLLSFLSVLVNVSLAQITYNTTNDQRCQQIRCVWTDPTIWNGGEVPTYANTTVTISSVNNIIIFVEAPISISSISVYGSATVYFNSTEANIQRITFYNASTVTLDNSVLNISLITISDRLATTSLVVQGGSNVTAGNIVLSYLNVSQNSTVTADHLTAWRTCSLTNSTITTNLGLTLAALNLLGQNTVNSLGVNSSSLLFAITQNDAQDPTSYLNLTVAGGGQFIGFGLQISNFYSPYARIIFNIWPQAGLLLSGNVTLLPYPADSTIASINGYGSGSLYISASLSLNEPDSTVITSSVPFASDFVLQMGSTLIVPEIRYPTILQSLYGEPGFVYSNVSTVITSGNAFTIIGNVVAQNLTVYALAFDPSKDRAPTFFVNGTLQIEGNITVIEEGDVWKECYPTYDTPLISSTTTSNITANLSDWVFIPWQDNGLIYDDPANHFVFSLVEQGGNINLRYTSSISDCKPAPHNPNRLPLWAIIAIAAGGGAVLVAIIAAVVVYRRRRAGYTPVMTNNNYS